MKLTIRRVRDHLQISFLILNELKEINQLLFPLKSSENQMFPDDFRGNRSYSLRSNSLNIIREL